MHVLQFQTRFVGCLPQDNMWNQKNVKFLLIQRLVFQEIRKTFIIVSLWIWTWSLFSFFFFLQQVVFLVHFDLEFLISKLNHLDDFLLSVKVRAKSTFLSNFQKLNVKVLFVDAAVAYTELHEQVFKQYFLRVFERCNSHGEHPKRESVVKVLGFGQTVIKQRYTHF